MSEAIIPYDMSFSTDEIEEDQDLEMDKGLEEHNKIAKCYEVAFSKTHVNIYCNKELLLSEEKKKFKIDYSNINLVLSIPTNIRKYGLEWFKENYM